MEDVRRFKNFSDREINVLITLTQKYSNIIENKKSNAITWKEKTEGWDTVAKEFGTLTGVQRSTKNLRGKWENIKKNTKKKFANEKQELYKTGGGPYVPTDINEHDYVIRDIVGVSVDGLKNDFDSDNIEIVFENNGYEETELTNTSTATSTYKEALSIPNNYTDDISLQSSTSETDVAITNPKASPLCVPGSANDDGTVECGKNWAKILKTPKSSQLSIKRKPVLNRPRKKADITNECKNRISALSEVKMELCQLQMECLKEDNARKQQDHELNLKQKKEIHLLEVQHKQLQLDLLKKQILHS